MKIDDAVVLVTGANRGLGRALVLATVKVARSGCMPERVTQRLSRNW